MVSLYFICSRNSYVLIPYPGAVTGLTLKSQLHPSYINKRLLLLVYQYMHIYVCSIL